MPEPCLSMSFISCKEEAHGRECAVPALAGHIYGQSARLPLRQRLLACPGLLTGSQSGTRELIPI